MTAEISSSDGLWSLFSRSLAVVAFVAIILSLLPGIIKAVSLGLGFAVAWGAFYLVKLAAHFLTGLAVSEAETPGRKSSSRAGAYLLLGLRLVLLVAAIKLVFFWNGLDAVYFVFGVALTQVTLLSSAYAFIRAKG